MLRRHPSQERAAAEREKLERERAQEDRIAKLSKINRLRRDADDREQQVCFLMPCLHPSHPAQERTRLRKLFDEEAKRLGLTEEEVRMRLDSDQKYQMELSTILGSFVVTVCQCGSEMFF